MLRGLSFGVYAGAARTNVQEVNQPPFFVPLSHIILFVSVSDSDTIYLVDCGSGAMAGTAGLTKPIALIPGIVIQGSAPPEEHRVSRGYALPISVLPVRPDDWILESRCGTEEYRVRYQFTTTEYFHDDFVGLSFDICVRAATILTQAVAAHKFFEVELGSGVKGLGRYSMYGAHVSEVIGAHKEDVAELKTEEERVKVLKELFGITLDKEEVQLIKGKPSALSG